MAETLWKNAASHWTRDVMKIKLWGPLSPLALSLAVLVLGVDQLHKWWMLQVFDIETWQPVHVTPFLNLVLVWNRGVSYGFLASHLQAPLIAVSVIVTAILWMWSCSLHSPVAVAAIGLVIGGALGNALDRIFYGAVADFFHLHWGSLSWYVFNLADVAIVAGVGLLLYESFRERSTR